MGQKVTAIRVHLKRAALEARFEGRRLRPNDPPSSAKRVYLGATVGYEGHAKRNHDLKLDSFAQNTGTNIIVHDIGERRTFEAYVETDRPIRSHTRS